MFCWLSAIDISQEQSQQNDLSLGHRAIEKDTMPLQCGSQRRAQGTNPRALCIIVRLSLEDHVLSTGLGPLLSSQGVTSDGRTSIYSFAAIRVSVKLCGGRGVIAVRQVFRTGVKGRKHGGRSSRHVPVAPAALVGGPCTLPSWTPGTAPLNRILLLCTATWSSSLRCFQELM